MKKEIIIKEKMSLMEWSNTLRNLPEDLWFKPFREGAWGIADVISHFISWDQFVMKNRIVFLLGNEDFPKLTIDADEINKQASNYARSGISQEELINEFIGTRKDLVTLLEKIPTEKFDQKYPGKEDMTLNDYFLGLIDHDLKHKQQIELHIKNK
ncbi:DinB family protein [Neobacillus sp. NRS-1170]|uniref:DinB family protein n=1 Tax=Neobacillus sp. NRS-1170 TaxID=3233898 RepID=UPI003D26563D